MLHMWLNGWTNKPNLIKAISLKMSKDRRNMQEDTQRNSYNSGNVLITKHWSAFVQPLLQWKSNEYCILWVCVCSFRYPACNAHAPYCGLWSAPALRYFSTLSHKHHDFRGKKIVEHKICVLSFCTTFVWNIYHSKKTERHLPTIIHQPVYHTADRDG